MNPLGLGFMQAALVACFAICVVAPLLGTFIVQRRQSLLGEGMGHVALAGAGAAYLFGFGVPYGVLGLCLLAAVLLHRLERGGLSSDLSLAILFYGGIALGFLMLSKSGLGVNRVIGLLFGSPLNLSWPDVGLIVALALIVLVTLVALHGPLTAIAFDEQASRVSGVPVDRLVVVLLMAVALVVVGGMYTIGLLLIAAMIVIPVAASSQLARSYAGTMLGGAAVGGFSAVAGLLGAFYADLTPGAAIVLVAVACYVVASLVRRGRQRVGLRDRTVRSGAAPAAS